jgi:glycosyltransferase involved in cell wall biosynthesis
VAKPPPRIYVDCSFIDFTKQPTGIPRVVLKYLEVGYAWGRRNNVEVIPVVPVADGLIICRPVPGAGAPRALLEKIETSETGSIQAKARLSAKNTLKYLRNIAHHCLFLLASVFPITPVKATSVWIDDALEQFCQAVEREVEKKNLAAIQMLPRQGDILFAPAYWHDVEPAIYAGLRAKGMIIVILVHDLLPIAFENFYPSPWRYIFKDNVRKAFGCASAFFCVSNFTKSMLLEFSHRQKIPPVPMMTAYNGFEPLVTDPVADQIRSADTKPLLGNARFYAILDLHPLIMVGSVEPKKGHIPVIKCLEAMWSTGFERALLIIGRTGWMERDVVTAIEGSFFFGKKLFWFSAIDDYDLAKAYLFCQALIFSSVAEGFGIPMIEASYYGKPTIAFDTAIVREILGEKGLLFSSAAGFVQHLVELEDPANYDIACAVAKSFRWPSWGDYTPNVFDVLARLGENEAAIPGEIAVSSDRTLTLAAAPAAAA